MHSHRSGQAGFSLIEVMIAVLILAIGILGAGALQTVGLQVSQGAYNRSQALVLASDIVDRMRANRTAVAKYEGVSTKTLTAKSPPSCLTNAAGCSPASIAEADLSNWKQAMDILPTGGYGTITKVSANNYTVTVRWPEREWSGRKRTVSEDEADWQSVTLRVSI